MSSSYPLENRVALITGGNTGIGRAVSLAYAKAGANIVIAWVDNAESVKTLKQEVEGLGRQFYAQHCDITCEAQVSALFSGAQDSVGHINLLVNNAGIQKAQPITQMSVNDFDQMLAVHLRGAFLCSREFVNYLANQPAVDADIRGHIINLCSQLGYIGRANYCAYSAAKGGMIAFTRALAKELAPQGILVNGVAPGLVDTGFDPLSDEAKREHADALPLGRLGEPDDMTSAFVFLASSQGRYYCGQLMHPNGGEIMP